ARTGTSLRKPQGLVLVLREKEMVREEAGVDVVPLLLLWIPDRELSAVLVQWHHLRRRMVRALLAEVRVVRPAEARAEIHAALRVHHRVVQAAAAVPNRLAPPVSRRLHRQVLRVRRAGLHGV